MGKCSNIVADVKINIYNEVNIIIIKKIPLRLKYKSNYLFYCIIDKSNNI